MRNRLIEKTRLSGVIRRLVGHSMLIICLFVAGCATNGARPATEADRKALLDEASGPPRLQAGDKIHVTVFGEQSLSGDYQIDPSGFVSLPLAGTVKAEGLTQQELEADLAKKLSGGYLKDPKITVSIAEFRPFYIVGEVQKPGMYSYTGGLTVLSAIAIAGGVTYRANVSTVLIQHAGASDMLEYHTDTPIPVLPGDIIQVPRRYI
jgi:protein involved in polysaccharide export with SLBB domain